MRIVAVAVVLAGCGRVGFDATHNRGDGGGTNDGISSRNEVGTNPVNLQIVDNTIIGAASACIRGASWTGTSQVVANNAIYNCAMGTVLAGTPVTAQNIGISASDVGTPPNVHPTACP